jgi:hypothetical protein|tara:strand:+ start:5698 stop:6576 length:879 start_codon:yes stop_codon:yes gene_type:complete
MELKFLDEIYEARMTRNSTDQKKLSYTDCGERLYLSLLILELLRQYPGSSKGIANGYAKKTVDNQNYKHFRMHGTDLYNLIYFVAGPEEAVNKLKDPAAALALRKRISFPLLALNGYLHKIASGGTVGTNSELFMRIENMLRINSEYKSIRRYLVNYGTASIRDKKSVTTKLLFAARAKLRNSDLISYLEELSTNRDLETSMVKDHEPTISIPDQTPTSNKDLMFYRYIVGPRNLVGTKKFLDMAKAGKSVPSPFIASYFPAIKLLDDIVKAGPGYITMLKALQKRALQSKK